MMNEYRSRSSCALAGICDPPSCPRSRTAVTAGSVVEHQVVAGEVGESNRVAVDAVFVARGLHVAGVDDAGGLVALGGMTTLLFRKVVTP